MFTDFELTDLLLTGFFLSLSVSRESIISYKTTFIITYEFNPLTFRGRRSPPILGAGSDFSYGGQGPTLPRSLRTVFIITKEINHIVALTVAKSQISYIVLLDGEETFQAYFVWHIPFTYYIDESGKIRYREMGFPSDGESQMEQKIRKLLKTDYPN